MGVSCRFSASPLTPPLQEINTRETGQSYGTRPGGGGGVCLRVGASAAECVCDGRKSGVLAAFCVFSFFILFFIVIGRAVMSSGTALHLQERELAK